MASTSEGDNFIAPALAVESNVNGQTSQADDVLTVGNKYSACGEPAKGHLGPYGPMKCLRGIVLSLSKKVEELERRCQLSSEEYRTLQELSSQRQEALLVTIDSLQNDIERLEEERRAGVANEQVSHVAHESCRLETESVLPRKPEDGGALTSRSTVRDSSDPEITGQHLDRRPTEISDVLDTMDTQNTRPAAGNAVQKSYALVADGPGGFTRVEPRRRGRVETPVKSAGSLSGAPRLKCKPFHLSFISLESTAEDVRKYCKSRNVLLTGCYSVKTKRWGTQSMKIYADSTVEAKILSDEFWPELVRCRAWTKEPPSTFNRTDLIPGSGVKEAGEQ